MPYQVTARKWRPQRFDEVVGQQAVTRTLGNALRSRRLAQAFVFAGPRGVGKTTTARILARALNCINGPTADPCGACDACVEIAEGRDMDVLEIDAATHTQVDNIREVIITGLSIAPVRNRYKVFIIDEVHQLSSHSFNALLKSIEEPPPHVVFMMATTELDKIPETVLSRSQVYEFRTISTKSIAEQLRRIVDAEGIGIGDESLQLIARDAEGSMRDAQSKLDQVVAFTGNTVGPTMWRQCWDLSDATCCSTRCRPSPTRTPWRHSSCRLAPSRWATTCAPSVASSRAWCAMSWC
jgi:DNA polymerase III subunit gamma/tau